MKIFIKESLKSFQESLANCSFWDASLISTLLIEYRQRLYCFLIYIFIIAFIDIYIRIFLKLKNIIPFANSARIITSCCIFGIRIEKQICPRTRKSKHFNETTGRRDTIAQRENSINQNGLKLFSKYARFESAHVPIYLNDSHSQHN